jgi:hypothetical protein
VGKVRTSLNLTGRKKKGDVEEIDRGENCGGRKEKEDKGNK